MAPGSFSPNVWGLREYKPCRNVVVVVTHRQQCYRIFETPQQLQSTQLPLSARTDEDAGLSNVAMHQRCLLVEECDRLL